MRPANLGAGGGPLLRGGHSEGLGWRVMRLFNAGHGALDAPAARPSCGRRPGDETGVQHDG